MTRILILDGHADTAETTAYILRELGHDAAIALTPAEAHLEIEREPADVLVIEWMIGHERRPDIVSSLRIQCERAGRHPFTIIHTTTAPSLTRTATCADVVLIKPTQVSSLVQILNRLEETRRVRASARVLVVDDLAERALDLRDSVRDVVGVDATVAIATPTGAMRAMSETRYDLVIGGAGNDRLACDLRAACRRRGQDPMFLCVTDRPDAQWRPTAGFDAHLLHPFTKHQLERLLLGSIDKLN